MCICTLRYICMHAHVGNLRKCMYVRHRLRWTSGEGASRKKHRRTKAQLHVWFSISLLRNRYLPKLWERCGKNAYGVLFVHFVRLASTTLLCRRGVVRGRLMLKVTRPRKSEPRGSISRREALFLLFRLDGKDSRQQAKVYVLRAT